jgi:hypothetical protein
MVGRTLQLNCGSGEWMQLRASILERDGHRCRNCGSEKELTVHHWRPVASESEGVSAWGYGEGANPIVVPASGLVTVCVICHGSLEAARERVKIRDRVEELAPQTVPERDWHNIFEVWDQNGRTLPFKVVRESWSQTGNHYYLVEKIEIRYWPYGFAWGRYVRDGNAGEEQKIRGAGSYQWRKVD